MSDIGGSLVRSKAVTTLNAHILARELAGLRVLIDRTKAQALQFAEILVAAIGEEFALPASFAIKRVGGYLRLVVGGEGESVFTDSTLTATHVNALAAQIQHGWIDELLRIVETARAETAISEEVYRAVLEGFSRGTSSLPDREGQLGMREKETEEV